MISMRYAWNLSHGDGLVWNPGERVEGYTNLLMVLWMAIWTAFLDKSGAVLAVQLSGVPTLLGIAGFSVLLWTELVRGGDVRNRRGFGALAFLGSLAYFPLAYWTLMGMETGLLTLLLVGGSLLSLRSMRTGRHPLLFGSALVFSLAYLTRPDSLPVAVVTLVLAAALGRGMPGMRARTMAMALGILITLPLLQAGFRATYYGTLVPVTYTLKATGMPLVDRIRNGLGFTMPFIVEARWLLIPAALGALAGVSRRKVLILLPPVVLIAYQIAVGGDAWPYWRMMAPGMPYLVLLTLAALDRGLTWLEAGGRWILPSRRVGSPPDGPPAPRMIWRMPLTPTVVALGGGAIVAVGALADLALSGKPGVGFVQRYVIAAGVLVILWALLMPRRPAGTLAALFAVFLILTTANRRFLRQATFFDPLYQVENNMNHVNVALSINEYTTDEASVGVVWAGIIPYYTSRYGIDFLGKNDPYIASLPADLAGVAWHGMDSVPGHNKYDLEYSILGRKPTYVEGFSWGSQDLSHVFRESYVEISLPGPDPAFRLGDPTVRWEIIPPEKILVP